MPVSKRCLIVAISFAGIAMAQSAQSPQSPYKGPGGCNGSNCHGSTRAADENRSRIMGDEYAIWAARRNDKEGSALDRHSIAYTVLSNDRSKRIAKALDTSGSTRAKVGDPQTSPRCLSCHAVGSPERSDGVACEACHGSSSHWLAIHTAPNSHESSVNAGMIDVRKLVVRDQLCLTCHLGTTKDQVVDHELIAAGHPDLAFELDTFSAAMPAHWREPKPATPVSLPRVQVWAVGQATNLAEGMKLLAAQAKDRWPQFAQLECYQCHHDLRGDGWRISTGYAGRTPGALQPNLARFEVLRVLVAVAVPENKASFDKGLEELRSQVNHHFTDGAAISDAAASLQRQADTLAAKFSTRDFTADEAKAIVRALAAESGRIAATGVHSAEQLTMALDSLTAKSASKAQQTAIDAVYRYLEHPSSYAPSEFAARFRAAAQAQ